MLRFERFNRTNRFPKTKIAIHCRTDANILRSRKHKCIVCMRCTDTCRCENFPSFLRRLCVCHVARLLMRRIRWWLRISTVDEWIKSRRLYYPRALQLNGGGGENIMTLRLHTSSLVFINTWPHSRTYERRTFIFWLLLLLLLLWVNGMQHMCLSKLTVMSQFLDVRMTATNGINFQTIDSDRGPSRSIQNIQ